MSSHPDRPADPVVAGACEVPDADASQADANVAQTPSTEQRLTQRDEASGGGPPSAGALAGADGSRPLRESEPPISPFRGRHGSQLTDAFWRRRRAAG